MESKNYIPLVRMTMVKEKEIPYETKQINSPEKVAELARRILEGADREYLLVISVDARSRPLALEIISIGTVNSAMAEPREIFKHAILNNAAGIILVHNHPSGDCKPSAADRQLTERIEKSGEILGIEVYDHVIIGDGYYSFEEEGESAA